jgi:hypothetical protein
MRRGRGSHKIETYVNLYRKMLPLRQPSTRTRETGQKWKTVMNCGVARTSPLAVLVDADGFRRSSAEL